MAPFEELPLSELPAGVLDAIAQDLAAYSVGFLRIESTPCGPDAVLLGSGTLVSVGATLAVLTAHHVVSILPMAGRLGLILGKRLQQHTVDTQGLTYLKIARGEIDAGGPDLGAVVFVPSISGEIAARKSFYNLDVVRERLQVATPNLQEGCWFINGFISEKTIEERGSDGLELIKGFYNLSGAGGPDAEIVVGDYDYFKFPVDLAVRPGVPKSFGGMSGGGLWQVPLTRNPRGELGHKTPILSGVVFYQEESTDGSRAVKCHGRQSIYRVAYDAIGRTYHD